MPGLAGAARTNPGRHRVLLRRPRQGLEPFLGLLGAATPRPADGRARPRAQLATAAEPGRRPHRARPPERRDHRYRVLSRRGRSPPAVVARGSRGGHPLHRLPRIPRETGPVHLGHARGRPPVSSRGRRRLAAALRSSLCRLPADAGGAAQARLAPTPSRNPARARRRCAATNARPRGGQPSRPDLPWLPCHAHPAHHPRGPAVRGHGAGPIRRRLS